MLSFIYITDIFCPWCYGFAPVMARLAAQYGFPVRVLCGNLVDEPKETASMGTPRLRSFFQRLADTTGHTVGEGFFALLDPEHSVVMDSTASARLVAAMKKLAPGHALEQMEMFQEAFYAQGRDVLSFDVQADMARRWDVEPEDLKRMLESEDVLAKSQKEMEEAEEILGDFVIYPTLFVNVNGTLHAVARGYAPYEVVAEKIEAVLASRAQEAETSPHACGIGGCC